MTQETRQCRNCRQQFSIEPDDAAFYGKMRVAVPDICSQCGVQRMMALRNERILYRRTCEHCKKETLSLYHPKAPFVVFCHDCWWSDSWDGMEHGMEYTASQSLIDQFKALQARVPREALIILNSTNCDYGNNVRESKDCYFSFLIAQCEKILYSIWMVGAKECMDDHKVVESELVFHSVDVAKSYHCAFLQDSSDCTDCHFSYDLKGCSNCLLCYNLRNKSHCIRNKQVSKEEYESELRKVLNGSYRSFLETEKEYEKLKKQALRKYAFLLKCGSDVVGNYLQNCGKTYWCFDGVGNEEVRYVASILNTKHAQYGYAIGTQPAEFLFGVSVIKGGSNNTNSFNLFNCNDCAWSDSLISCSKCVACVGLKNKKYCILNREYRKEEYETIIRELEKKEEFAKLVSSRFGTFGYNETAAHDYYPLTKQEAIALGYSWQDDFLFTTGKETLSPEQLLDNISEANDDILKEVFRCIECKRNYRMVAEELRYLRSFLLPLPRICPQCRFAKRRAARLPFKLWKRQCMCDYNARTNSANHVHHAEGRCPNEFETSYAPDRKEIVYCEQCYNAEVV